jgi:two-component system, cell cycle sensor histidine kinase and response regulator CckA
VHAITSMSILIVDDDPLTVEMLQNILLRAGYLRVHGAGDSVAGFSLVPEVKPDLIVLDLQMPGMSGLEFCRQLRNSGGGKDIPVIMITAGSGNMDEIINQAFDAGCFDFISKPLRAAEVLARIKSALTIRRALLKLQDELQLRAEIEKVLQASEYRFRAIAELTPDAIVIVDSKEHIVYWNRGAEQMFGYTRDEVMGRPMYCLLADRFRDDDQRGFNAIAKSEIAGLYGKIIEAYGLKKSGQEFPMEGSMAAWQEDDEVFFSATIRDLSERYNTEAQRIEREKLNSVLEMAGAVCHELNQPLQVIMGYAEMLQQNLPPDSPQQLRVEKISAQAEKLGNITQKLAAITRYETKSYIQKTRIVDIHKASEK